jgi:Domain of unknown function (DUF6378)
MTGIDRELEFCDTELYKRIAEAWEHYICATVKPEDVLNLLMIMRLYITRESAGEEPYTDIMRYAYLSAEIRSENR